MAAGRSWSSACSRCCCAGRSAVAAHVAGRATGRPPATATSTGCWCRSPRPARTSRASCPRRGSRTPASGRTLATTTDGPRRDGVRATDEPRPAGCSRCCADGVRPVGLSVGVGLAGDVGAERAQLLDEARVAAVDVVDVADVGDALRDQPGEHQPGAGADVGGLAPAPRTAAARPRTTAWWPSVRTSAPSRAISLTNMNRRLEDVLGDHRRARRRPQFSAITMRLQVGREARVGQRHDVDRASAGGPSAPGSRRRRTVDARAGRGASLSSAISRCSASRAADGDVALRDRGGERPGPGDDPVGHGRVRRPACSSVDALDRRASTCRRRRSRAPICASIAADVDDLRLAGRVVDHRGALGQDRGHQQVLGGADAREVQPDRSRRCSPCGARGDEEAVLAVELGAQLLEPGDVHVQRRASRWRRRRAAPPRPRRSARAAARARRSRRASGGPGRSRPGGRARPARRSRPSRSSGVVLDRRSPSRRSSSAMISTSRMSRDVGERGAALGQQRGRHQLQHAVLRAGDPRPRRTAGAADDPEPAPRRHRRRSPSPGRAARHVRRLAAHGQPHPHLHPDRRRRHDGARRHEPDQQERPPARSPTPTSTRPTARIGVALAPATARRRRRRAADSGPERPVRRRRRPVHAGRSRPGVPAAAGRAGLRRRARGGHRPLQRATCRSCARSCCRAARRRGAPARRAHRRPPRRAGDLGGARGRARRRR